MKWILSIFRAITEFFRRWWHNCKEEQKETSRRAKNEEITQGVSYSIVPPRKDILCDMEFGMIYQNTNKRKKRNIQRKRGFIR